MKGKRQKLKFYKVLEWERPLQDLNIDYQGTDGKLDSLDRIYYIDISTHSLH